MYNNITWLEYIVGENSNTCCQKKYAAKTYTVSFTDGKLVQQRIQNKNNLYENVPSGHTTDSVKVSVLEPCCVNPNSFKNLEKVINHLDATVRKQQTGSGYHLFVTVSL